MKELKKSLKTILITTTIFMTLAIALCFAFQYLAKNMISQELDSSSKKTEQYISVDNVKYRIVNSFEQEKSSVAEKDNEQVSMSAAEAGWSQAVADGGVGLKIIDSVGKFILNGYKSLNYAVEDFYRQAVAEDGIELFKLFDKVIRNSTTSYSVTSKIFDTTTPQITNPLNESAGKMSYKEAELSKARTDLINLEYNILGAPKADNKILLINLEHYVFLRVLDLEEQIKDKRIMLEKYSKDRNEKLDIFFYPSRFSAEKQQSLLIQESNSDYAILIQDIDKKQEIIKDMQANIFKAIQIIQSLEDRISMQEKYEELEEVLLN